MIKNVFKRFLGVGIFIVFGCLFGNNCFGYENITNCYNNGFQMSCVIVDAGEEFVIKNDTNTITNIMNFDNTTYSNAIAVTLNGSPAYQSIIYWGNDGNPYTVFNRTTAYNPNGAYKINYLCGGEYETLTGTNSIMGYCGVSNNNTDNYGANHYDKTLEEIIQATQGKTPTNYIYHYYNGNDYNLVVCANYEDINYAWCIPGMRQTYSQWSNIYTLMTNGNSANIGITYMEENIGQSPIVIGGGSNGGTLIPTSTDVDVAINYYESIKGFNENMCYVGTNNLTADFGTSGISFEEGTGSTIFELYNSQFSGFGNNIITNVGKFINVRTLNYGQWYYEGDNIKRLATDNGPDNGVSYIYTGFTFPFANKPVAIFFMASNLLDGYFTQQSMGNDVAFYCYLKLNYTSLSNGDISYTGDVLPLVPPAIQNNVEDYFKYQLNYGNSGYYYSPDWIGSWSGDYELSDNLELDGVFTNFLDNFNSKLGNIDFGFTFGIIPDWILYPLIFLILFRIMKH